MSRRIPCLVAAAALGFAPVLWAAEYSNAPLIPIISGIRGMVSCHGTSNVPITSDKLQSLPLKVVATLQCGDEVVLLAQGDEYTAKIRTIDGKDGYIASMYLGKPTEATTEAQPPEAPVSKDGIVRWRNGSRGSSFFYSEDAMVESLTANGITVQVALQDTGWKLHALVAVANNGSQEVEVPAPRISLDELKPRIKFLSYQNPEKLAKSASHHVLWNGVDAAPTPAESELKASANGQSHSAYSFSTLQPVNYLAGLQDTNRERRESASSRNARLVREQALPSSSVSPNGKIAGSVWFERAGNPGEMSLLVPVGDMLFEFSFSF